MATKLEGEGALAAGPLKKELFYGFPYEHHAFSPTGGVERGHEEPAAQPEVQVVRVIPAGKPWLFIRGLPRRIDLSSVCEPATLG